MPSCWKTLKESLLIFENNRFSEMITNIYKVNSKSMKLLCYIIIALNSAIRFLITFHAFHPQVTNYVSELRAITSETKS